MNDSPAVSIVVATHNRAELLPLALDSALAQDYPNLEILVMDDGSTDETPEILAGYAARLPRERFRYFSHPNVGQARATNRGWELSRGEFLGYLCDDDLLEPKQVSTLVRALAQRPDAAVAYPSYRLIDMQGRVLDTWLPLEYTATTALCRHDTMIGPGGLARRAAIEASGGWDPDYWWMGDLIMWMRVARWGPVLRVNEPLASWRKNPEGLTAEVGLRRGAEHLRLFNHGLALVPAVAQDPTLRAQALHTACIMAAWFSGHTQFAPAEPISMIDQDRPLISAWASGQDVATGRFELGQAEPVADALRKLGQITLRLADTRGRRSAVNGRPGGGYERAVQRLRAVGALPDEHGQTEPLDSVAFGPALIASALDCQTNIHSSRDWRFLVPDRDQSRLAASELEALVHLTLAGPAHGRGMLPAVQAEILRREHELGSAEVSAKH